MDAYDEHNRPRRADPKTVAYLRSLPLDEAAAEEEVRLYLEARRLHANQDVAADNDGDGDGGDGAEADYPQSLTAAHAALDEIEHELASLAGEEHGSQTIETVARVAAGLGRSELAARRLLAGLAGYHLHLACHRYGSHVVQTILGCAVRGGGLGGGTSSDEETQWLREEDAAEEETSSSTDGPPPVTELVLAMADELLPHARQLAVHVCGSHVLRALLCALGSVELVSYRGGPGGGPNRMELGGTRRGKAKDSKKKKKKKKKAQADGDAANGGSTVSEVMVRIKHSRIDATHSGIRHALRSAVSSLSGGDGECKEPGELQQLACHPSAGPLLAVLIRVLTHAPNTTAYRGGETAAPNDGPKEDENSSIADHRLGIAHPEPVFIANSDASKLVKSILCWRDQAGSDVFAQTHAGDVIYGLSGEPRGSHILETILHTSDDSFHDEVCQAGRFFDPAAFREYAEHDVSNFVLQALFVSVRTKDQANKLMKCVEPIISSGYVLDRSKRRGGLLWRASEMCAKHFVGQEILLHAIRTGCSILANLDLSSNDSKADADANAEKGGKKMRHKKRKREESFELLNMKECIPLLVDIKPPEKEGGRAMLDVGKARCIHHLLHFSPKLCKDILSGITQNFTAQELEWIANDGLGSRCIMDAIVVGGETGKPFSTARRQLLEKLSGRWVALSVERVGHHLVQNLFKGLASMVDKATLTAELARGMNKLGGNAMGRKVIMTCAVKEFLEGEMEWNAAVTKQARREEWLKDVLEADVRDVSEDGDQNAAVEGKKKRKRKKKKKNTTNTVDGIGENAAVGPADE